MFVYILIAQAAKVRIKVGVKLSLFCNLSHLLSIIQYFFAKSNSFLKTDYQISNNLITVQHTGKQDTPILYISCSEKITSFTGEKNSFIGKVNISNPEAIIKLK